MSANFYSDVEAELVYKQYEAMGKQHLDDLIQRFLDEGWHGMALKIIVGEDAIDSGLYSIVISETITRCRASLFAEELLQAFQKMGKLGYKRNLELFEGVILTQNEWEILRDLYLSMVDECGASTPSVDAHCGAVLLPIFHTEPEGITLEMFKKCPFLRDDLVQKLFERHTDTTYRTYKYEFCRSLQDLVITGHISLHDPDFLVHLITALLEQRMEREALSFFRVLPEAEHWRLEEPHRIKMEAMVFSSSCASLRPWEAQKLYETGELGNDDMLRIYIAEGWHGRACSFLSKTHKSSTKTSEFFSEDVLMELLRSVLSAEGGRRARFVVRTMEEHGFTRQNELREVAVFASVKPLYQLYREMKNRGILENLETIEVQSLKNAVFRGLEHVLSQNVTLNPELCIGVILHGHRVETVEKTLGKLLAKSDALLPQETLDECIRKLAYFGQVTDAFELWNKGSSKPVNWLVESTETLRQAFEVVQCCMKKAREFMLEAVKALLLKKNMRKPRASRTSCKWSLPPSVIKQLFHEIAAAGSPPADQELSQLLGEELSTIGLFAEERSVCGYKPKPPDDTPTRWKESRGYGDAWRVMEVLIAHMEVWSIYQLHTAAGNESSHEMIIERYLRQGWHGMALYALGVNANRMAYTRAIHETLQSGRGSLFQQELLAAFERMHANGHARGPELFREMMVSCDYDDIHTLFGLCTSMVEECGEINPQVRAECGRKVKKKLMSINIHVGLDIIVWCHEEKHALLEESVKAFVERILEGQLSAPEEPGDDDDLSDEEYEEEWDINGCSLCWSDQRTRLEPDNEGDYPHMLQMFFIQVITRGIYKFKDPELLRLLFEAMSKYEMRNEAASIQEILSGNISWDELLPQEEDDFCARVLWFMEKGWHSHVVDMFYRGFWNLDCDTLNKTILVLFERFPAIPSDVSNAISHTSYHTSHHQRGHVYDLEVYEHLLLSQPQRGLSGLEAQVLKPGAPASRELYEKLILEAPEVEILKYALVNDLVGVGVLEQGLEGIFRAFAREMNKCAWVVEFAASFLRHLKVLEIDIPLKYEKQLLTSLLEYPWRAFYLWEETSKVPVSWLVMAVPSGNLAVSMLVYVKEKRDEMLQELVPLVLQKLSTTGKSGCIKRLFHDFIASGDFEIREEATRREIIGMLLKNGFDVEAASLRKLLMR